MEMDFQTMVFLELQQPDLDVNQIYQSTCLLFDLRSWKSKNQIMEISSSFGIIGDDLSMNPFSGMAPYINNGDFEFTIKINRYTKLEPRYIPFVNDNQCDQRREAIRHWIVSRISRTKCGVSHQVFKSRKYHISKGSEKKDKILARLLHNFMKLPREIVMSSHLSFLFPLPLIDRKVKFDHYIKKWLSAMTLWKIITREVHSISCHTIRSKEKISKGDVQSGIEKSQQTKKLSLLLDRCKMLNTAMKEYEEVVDEDDIHYHQYKEGDRLLHKKKPSKLQDKAFLEHIILLSVKLVRNAVIYLVNMRDCTDKNKIFYSLMEITQKTIQKIEDKTSKLYKKRKDATLDSCGISIVGVVLERIARITKFYSLRKFILCSKNGDGVDLAEQTLSKIRKYICWLLDAVVSGCIQHFHNEFSIVTKLEHLTCTAESLNLYISWTAMNSLMRQRYILRDTKSNPIPRSFYVREALRELAMDVVHEALPIVHKTMKYCEDHIFFTRQEDASVVILTVSTLRNDFQEYRNICCRLSYACHHPLTDIDTQTDKKFYRFLKDTFACYEKNTKRFKIVLKNAEKYLKHVNHLKN